MLFPYLNWKSKNEICSIVGVIPYSLLNSCFVQEGFSSIQQQIHIWLTYPSNTMGSDTRSHTMR